MPENINFPEIFVFLKIFYIFKPFKLFSLLQTLCIQPYNSFFILISILCYLWHLQEYISLCFLATKMTLLFFILGLVYWWWIHLDLFMEISVSLFKSLNITHYNEGTELSFTGLTILYKYIQLCSHQQSR